MVRIYDIIHVTLFTLLKCVLNNSCYIKFSTMSKVAKLSMTSLETVLVGHRHLHSEYPGCNLFSISLYVLTTFVLKKCHKMKAGVFYYIVIIQVSWFKEGIPKLKLVLGSFSWYKQSRWCFDGCYCGCARFKKKTKTRESKTSIEKCIIWSQKLKHEWITEFPTS